jgi:hypothetical protein
MSTHSYYKTNNPAAGVWGSFDGPVAAHLAAASANAGDVVIIRTADVAKVAEQLGVQLQPAR